jgi:hypothetical protein
MEFGELMQHIFLLSAEERKALVNIINESSFTEEDDLLDRGQLSETPELQEINKRTIDVIFEEKPCLIEFDEHLRSLQ